MLWENRARKGAESDLDFFFPLSPSSPRSGRLVYRARVPIRRENKEPRGISGKRNGTRALPGSPPSLLEAFHAKRDKDMCRMVPIPPRSQTFFITFLPSPFSQHRGAGQKATTVIRLGPSPNCDGPSFFPADFLSFSSFSCELAKRDKDP